MKKLTLINNGEFKLEEHSTIKNPNEDFILVKTIKVGICSSDIPRAFDSKAYYYPLILGHEFSVEIIEDKKKELKSGQKCAVFPLLPCFECESCKKKKYNMCSNYSYYGSRVDGGMQGELYIKRWNLIPLPDEIDSISASLIEPTAVCIHASEKISPNQKILIYGGGFLAQILAQLLLKKSCEITCIDRNEYKKKFFNSEVKFVISEEELLDSSFDFVIECCGADSILGKCISFGKPGATIMQLANPYKDTIFKSKEISLMMRKEQKIIGTWNSDYRPDNPAECDWNKTIELLKNNELSIKNLITHQSSLEDAKDLLLNINSRKEKANKIKNFNKAIIEI